MSYYYYFEAEIDKSFWLELVIIIKDIKGKELQRQTVEQPN